jgi:sulfonate transport system substrate-binding protein
MFNRRTLAQALVLVPLALSGTASRAESLPPVIRFGDVGFGFGTPFGEGTSAIADAKGFIADEFKGTPVKLEFNYFIGTGPAINEAISNKQLDFASYGAVPNVIGKASGLPTKVIVSYGGTNIFAAARSDLPIKSIADLKGARIAVQKATIIHWGLIRALEENGLSQKDVTLVDLKNADQLAALAAKSVDAVFGANFLLPLREKGLANIVYRSKDLGPKGQGFGAFLVTDDFARTYPDATARVVRGYLRAAEWLSKDENREEAFQIWSRTGTPPALYRDTFEGQSLKDAYNPLLDEFFLDRYRSVVAFNKDQKLIRRDVDLAEFVDRSFVDRALKDLHFERTWPSRRADGAATN